MENLNHTNKPNIRTKHSTFRRSKVPNDINVSLSTSTLLLFMCLLAVVLPQLAQSLTLPSSLLLPSSLKPSSSSSVASVLRIDPSTARIHIRLRSGAPLLEPISISSASTSRVDNPASLKSAPQAAALANDDVLVHPSFSPVACDQDIVGQPLDVLGYENGELIVSYANVVGFGEAYLCVTEGGQLRHLGEASRFEVKSRSSRIARDVSSKYSKVINEQLDPTTLSAKEQDEGKAIRIYGLRVESSEREPNYDENGVPEIMSDTCVRFRFFGQGFSNRTIVTLTEEKNILGGSCEHPASGQYQVQEDSVEEHTMVVEMMVPRGKTSFYFCTKSKEENPDATKSMDKMNRLMHQGANDWMMIKSYDNILPAWAAICIIVTCLGFSALFSGLNLGLMSLDRTELKILKSTGTGKEREYAAIIQPIRDHGNYLLCSILLGNVLVNSTFTILLDGLTSGLVAVVCSTLLIVVFGEITPQAACSRHGLAVGAKTIWITKMVMVLTFPLAYPTSKLLDYMLGEEIGAVYNRERLKELVRVTKDINDLDKEEVNIISGALELRKKTVADVMTHIEDAFMLSYDAVLDFETVSEIMKSGFSRIPVYEGDRQNVLTLLFIKDLAFVDPDDNTPLRTLCEFYQNSCHFVFEDVTLDVMFKRFKEGHRGHMAFVHRVNSSGDGDPFYETVGLITLEDVIEELIQSEIVDETDVYTDNRMKVRRSRTKKHDFTIFAERRENHHIRISPQLTLATFQYLTTTVDAFKSDSVSETILRRLLNQDVMHHIRCKGKEKTDPSIIIYQQGKPVDYFVLILEGRVEVTVGREGLVFESGPFTYFGTQALVPNSGVSDIVEAPQAIRGSIQSLNMDALLRHSFVPDYSVRAVTEVFYIAIKRTLYLAAKRATLMEQAQKMGEPGSNEPMDEEVEKLLHSLDGDDHSITTHTANLNLATPRDSKPPSHQTSPANDAAASRQNTVAETNGTIHEDRESKQLDQRKLSADESSAPLLPN